MAQTQPETQQQLTASQSGKSTPGRNPADPKSNPADPKNGASTSPDASPTDMLSADHRHVEQLFSSFEKATDAAQKSQLAAQICTELMVHTLIEEEIFYPACRDHMEERVLEEAQVEHDAAKALIIEIRAGSPDDQYYDAKVKVLSDEIKHHVQEEEKPNDGIFAKAKEGGVATPDLAKRLAARKQQLMEEAKAGTLGPPETRSFHVRTNSGMNQLSQEHKMARGSSSTMERERDERGRFVSDDDDRDYRRRSSSRSRYDDDRRRSMPARDDEGRFTSSRSRFDDDDDDDRRGPRGHSGWYGDPEGHSEASRQGWEERSGSRMRYRDDDDDRRGRRGHGGWYGDPEGHSEASRQGWEERGGSRMRYRDDDDDRRYSRSRSRDDDEDDRRGSRGHGGWFGDPEGHSEASRRGWEERGGSRARYREDDRRRSMPARDDEGRFTSSRSRYDDDDDDDRRGRRGHGGWYGDPEGHSEASRQGWEERSGSRTRYRDDDDDRGYSRSRDDDDRRGSRGHGGWYGDPEGHSQAARRGRR
jgi:hypothetical protein